MSAPVAGSPIQIDINAAVEELTKEVGRLMWERAQMIIALRDQDAELKYLRSLNPDHPAAEPAPSGGS